MLPDTFAKLRTGKRRLPRERRTTMPAPQIETGRAPEENLNVRHMLPLPADTPFGNLSLKYTLIIERLDHVNLMLRTVYESHERALADPFSGALLQHTLVAEQVIYWLRKTADELIGLYHLLTSREEIGRYPDRVSPESIGQLLHSKTTAPLFADHIEFLATLNDISNAYKHSFINSDLNLVGRYEPVVNALGLRYNNLRNEPTLSSVPLRDIVAGFNAFFATVAQYLRSCSIPHQSRQTSGNGTDNS